MYGLALCLPSVGQPQGLPVPHKILKTRNLLYTDRRNTDGFGFYPCSSYPCLPLFSKRTLRKNVDVNERDSQSPQRDKFWANLGLYGQDNTL